MLEKKFRVTKEDIERANNKMIEEGKFKEKHPILYKIKKYFEKPTACKVTIGDNERKNEPNFYRDFSGYKQIPINLSREQLNESWKKATAHYNKNSFLGQ